MIIEYGQTPKWQHGRFLEMLAAAALGGAWGRCRCFWDLLLVFRKSSTRGGMMLALLAHTTWFKIDPTPPAAGGD